MYNGIKPTRLWHLTSRKEFESILKNRRTMPGSDFNFSVIDHLKLRAFIITCTLGIAYSYGMLDVKKKGLKDDKCGSEKSKLPERKPPKEPCMEKITKEEHKPCKRD